MLGGFLTWLASLLSPRLFSFRFVAYLCIVRPKLARFRFCCRQTRQDCKGDGADASRCTQATVRRDSRRFVDAPSVCHRREIKRLGKLRTRRLPLTSFARRACQAASVAQRGREPPELSAGNRKAPDNTPTDRLQASVSHKKVNSLRGKRLAV